VAPWSQKEIFTFTIMVLIIIMVFHILMIWIKLTRIIIGQSMKGNELDSKSYNVPLD